MHQRTQLVAQESRGSTPDASDSPAGKINLPSTYHEAAFGLTPAERILKRHRYQFSPDNTVNPYDYPWALNLAATGRESERHAFNLLLRRLFGFALLVTGITLFAVGLHACDNNPYYGSPNYGLCVNTMYGLIFSGAICVAIAVFCMLPMLLRPFFFKLKAVGSDRETLVLNGVRRIIPSYWASLFTIVPQDDIDSLFKSLEIPNDTLYIGDQEILRAFQCFQFPQLDDEILLLLTRLAGWRAVIHGRGASCCSLSPMWTSDAARFVASLTPFEKELYAGTPDMLLVHDWLTIFHLGKRVSSLHLYSLLYSNFEVSKADILWGIHKYWIAPDAIIVPSWEPRCCGCRRRRTTTPNPKCVIPSHPAAISWIYVTGAVDQGISERVDLKRLSDATMLRDPQNFVSKIKVMLSWTMGSQSSKETQETLNMQRYLLPTKRRDQTKTIPTPIADSTADSRQRWSILTATRDSDADCRFDCRQQTTMVDSDADCRFYCRQQSTMVDSDADCRFYCRQQSTMVDSDADCRFCCRQQTTMVDSDGYARL